LGAATIVPLERVHGAMVSSLRDRSADLANVIGITIRDA
jgi:hypothetical protein